MNRTLLDTDIYSEILRAVNPTVIGHAQTYRQAVWYPYAFRHHDHGNG